MDRMSRQDCNIIGMRRDDELSNILRNLGFDNLRLLTRAQECHLSLENSLGILEHDLPQIDYSCLVPFPLKGNSLTVCPPMLPSGTPDLPNGSPSPQL